VPTVLFTDSLLFRKAPLRLYADRDRLTLHPPVRSIRIRKSLQVSIGVPILLHEHCTAEKFQKVDGFAHLFFLPSNFRASIVSLFTATQPFNTSGFIFRPFLPPPVFMEQGTKRYGLSSP
jgi:hypothetical protein